MGDQTLSFLAKAFPAPKSRIGDSTLSALSKEFSIHKLRQAPGQSSLKADPNNYEAMSHGTKFKLMRKTEKLKQKQQVETETIRTLSKANANVKKRLFGPNRIQAGDSVGTMDLLERELEANDNVSFDTQIYR